MTGSIGRGDFVIGKPAPHTTTPSTSRDEDDAERKAFLAALGSDNPAPWRTFLAAYPNGPYADRAHEQLEKLSKIVMLLDRTDLLRDGVRQAMRDEKIGVTGLGVVVDGVQVRVLEPAEYDKAEAKLKSLARNRSGSLLSAPAYNVSLERGDAGLFKLHLSLQAR